MNAITRRLPEEFVPVAATAPLHPVLAAALSSARHRLLPDPARTGEDPGYLAPPPEPLDEAGRALAKAAVEDLDEALAPVGLAQFAAWLVPINAAAANPLAEDTFRLKARALHQAFTDSPRGAFTVETNRQAMRRFKFFPSAAEIEELIAPTARRLLEDHRHLRDLATRTPETAQRQPRVKPDEEAIASVRRQMDGLRAHLRASDDAMRPRKATNTPKHLTAEQLIPFYAEAARKGCVASQARLEALRKEAQGNG